MDTFHINSEGESQSHPALLQKLIFNYIAQHIIHADPSQHRVADIILKLIAMQPGRIEVTLDHQ